MQKLASTQSGGSAKRPTAMTIELGVSNNMDALTLSASAHNQPTRLSIHSDLTISLGIYYYQGAIVESVFSVSEKVWDDSAWTLQDGLDRALVSHLLDTAFVRYFQIWGNLTSDLFRRALNGTKATQQSCGGKIGGFNSSGLLKKNSSGGSKPHWYTDTPEELYKYVSLMPLDGIQKAKQVARGISK